MLTEGQVERIKQLHAEGYAQRTISFHLHVARGTVANVIHGRPVRQPAQLSVEDPPPFSGPLERCPGCGGMVQMPCLLCRVKAYMATRKSFAG